MTIKKTLTPLLIANLLILSCFTTLTVIPEVKAEVVTQKFDSMGNYHNAYIESFANTFADAHAGTGILSASTGNGEMTIGQSYNNDPTDQYYVNRGFIYIDTSTIPDNAVILDAKLQFIPTSKTAEFPFSLYIQNGQPTHPQDNAPAVSDFFEINYSGNGGSINAADIISNVACNLTFSSEGLEWINKAGVTKLCMRSSDDLYNTWAGTNVVSFYTSYVALFVTYAQGLYYSNMGVSGTLANSTITVSSFWQSDMGLPTSYTFSTDNSGMWTTESYLFSGENWANVTFILNPNVGQVVNYQFSAMDSSGTVTLTPIMSLTTTGIPIFASSDEHSFISPSGTIFVPWMGSETFYFGADSGYSIQTTIINNESVSVGSPYTFSGVMAPSDITISTSDQYFFVTLWSDWNSRLYRTDTGVAGGSHRVAAGNVFSVRAEANPGYVLYDFKINGQSSFRNLTANQFSFIPTQDTTLELFSTSTSGGGGGGGGSDVLPPTVVPPADGPVVTNTVFIFGSIVIILILFVMFAYAEVRKPKKKRRSDSSWG